MGTPFKMKGMSFGNSPMKNNKGDNLKRMMTEAKEFKKKTGTYYKSGAGPKVNTPNVKGFNVKGTSGSGKKILTKQQKTANFKAEGAKTKTVSSKTGGFDKWMKTIGKRATGILGFMGGGSLSATAGNVRKKSEGEQIKDLLKKLNQ